MVLVFALLSQVIRGSFNGSVVDEEKEIVRKGSFIYAANYLNPQELMIEGAYTYGDYFEDMNMVLRDSAYLAVSCPSFIDSLAQNRTEVIAYEV